MKTNLLLSAALSLCLCAVSTAQTLPAYLPNDGLVGWWPFNGNANDESGNGNNGTVNGATLTEDRFGVANAAYDFDGVDDLGTLPPMFDQGLDEFTISLWFKSDLNQTGNFSDILLQNANALNSANPANSIVLRYLNESLTFSCGLGLNNPNPTPIIATPPPSLIWHHIIMLKTSNEFSLYIDGEFIQTINGGGVYASFGQSLFFGNVNYPAYPLTNGYAGEIDDIAIYNRALTPEEITALYTGEPVNPPTACNPLPSNLQNGLVGYWPFCGNANDESGNGNDGTVNGATLTEDRFGVANAAYSFDGVDDYISASISNLDFVGTSVSVWVNLTNITDGPDCYLQWSNQNLSSGGGFVYDPSLNKVKLFSTAPQIVATDSLFLNNWTNYIYTYNSQNQSIEFWVNGNLAGSSIGTASNLLEFLNIGRTYSLEWGYGWYMNGAIDDIGIWNRALTPDEVQQLYTLNACTFTIYDTTNVTIYDTVSVSVSTTDTLIINTLITSVEPAQENTFLVYPNPASTQITINNGNVAILGGYSKALPTASAKMCTTKTSPSPKLPSTSAPGAAMGCMCSTSLTRSKIL